LEGMPGSFLLASLHSVFIAVSAIRSDIADCPRAVVAPAVNRREKSAIPRIDNFPYLDNREHVR
jgi:hypothetical protein